MKISRYTFLFKGNSEEEYYIYNTLTNSLLEIDEESYLILNKDKNNVDKNIFDEELYNILIEKRILVEDDRDEFLLYKSIINRMRASSDSMHLTIAPTMDCNFRCHYCFEQKEKKYMSCEVMDSIIKYLEKNEEVSAIHLTWFGGEPLMAIDSIKIFYHKFKKMWKKRFSSDIITTGYHLSSKVIKILQEVEISSIQITLDGSKDSHNTIKQTSECQDVFSRIINNIDLLIKTAPEIRVNIRVNLSKKNASEYPELYQYFYERYRGKNIIISPAFIKDKGIENSKIQKESYFFNRHEKSEYILNLFSKYSIVTPWLQYPSNSFLECAIRNKHSINFDPDGYAYKCWEVIGNKKYAIGKLIDGQLTHINHTILNRHLYGADPIENKMCSSCAYLPICNGGCPIERIENEYECGNIDMCTYHKSFLPDFLNIYIDLKNRLAKN